MSEDLKKVVGAEAELSPTEPTLSVVPSASDLSPIENSANEALVKQWHQVLTRLHGRLGDAAFSSWMKPVELLSADDGVVQLGIPTRFMKDWVMNHYGAALKELWAEENPSIHTVAMEVIKASGYEETGGEQSPAPLAKAGDLKISAEAKGAGSTVTDISQLDPRFTFDNFVVGKPNELAFAAAKRVAESPVVQFNPLFLYGGVGLGKTHLMHAIAWHIREQAPDRRVLYMSAEKFMYQFIKALRYKDTMAFKEKFRNVDVLMIDDVQFISGKDSTQEEFFHTFNALVDQNHQVIISADKSPSDLEGVEERLRSRLGWGLVADIHPTTYELRCGILQAKAETLDVEIPPSVCEFLAHKITSNVRELEGALNRIAAHSSLVGREVSVEMAQETLRDLLRVSERRATIDEIQTKVAEHYNIRVSDMHSARRSRVVARPRQVAMFLCKKVTEHSLPEIGRKFGGRDHTTVMHAVKTIEGLIKSDSELRESVGLLEKMLTT